MPEQWAGAVSWLYPRTFATGVELIRLHDSLRAVAGDRFDEYRDRAYVRSYQTTMTLQESLRIAIGEAARGE